MNDFFKNDFFKIWQDAAKDLQNFNPLQGMQNWDAFQAPQFIAVDFNKLFTLQRKNLEAFSAAQKMLNEGAQAIARRGAEFIRENMEDALSTSRDVVSNTAAPDKAAAKQADYAKNFVKNTTDQLREVSEMASKTHFEAFDILSSRFSRSVEEAKDFTAPKAGKKAA